MSAKIKFRKKKRILSRATAFTTKASDYVPKKILFTRYSLHRCIPFNVGASCK